MTRTEQERLAIWLVTFIWPGGTTREGRWAQLSEGSRERMCEKAAEAWEYATAAALPGSGASSDA